VEGRIVSATCRIYYSGSVLNKSGTIYGFNEPNNDSILNQSMSFLSSRRSCQSHDVVGGDEDVLVASIPCRESHFDFPGVSAGLIQSQYPYSDGQSAGGDPTSAGNSANIGVPVSCIYISGQPGVSFNIEYCVRAEFVGTAITQSLTTMCHSDPVGMNIVQDVLSSAQMRVGERPGMSFRTAVYNELAYRGIRMDVVLR